MTIAETVQGDSGVVPLREYLEARMRDADARGTLKDTLEYRALVAAMSGLDKRLDSMNEFRGTISDLVSKSMSRLEIEARFAATEAKIGAEVGPVAAKVDGLAQTNWPLLGTFVTIAFTALFGLWVIIGLKIDAASQPLSLQVSANQVAAQQIMARLTLVEGSSVLSVAADSQSRADRAQLNARLTTVEQEAQANAGTVHSNAETTAARLVEIETQFRGASNVLNLQLDHAEQLMGMVWQKAMGTALPPTTFRPELAKSQ